MSMVGATRKHGVENSGKRYNTIPDYLKRSKQENLATKKFIEMMRLSHGRVWTPSIDDAVAKGNMGKLRQLLGSRLVKKT